MRSRRWFGPRAGLLVTTILVAALGVGSTASAHEHREVGEYEITIGFLNEPAILEEPNGLDLRVAHGHGDEGVPVEGLADTLQAEVIYGDVSMALALRPAFGAPGAYQANFIPTAGGAYTFHVTGNIEGMEIDESFTSGPDTFSEVEERAAMSFPNSVAAVGAVAADASDATGSADSARTLSIIAIVIGTLGLGAGLAASVRGRRPSSGADAAAD